MRAGTVKFRRDPRPDLLAQLSELEHRIFDRLLSWNPAQTAHRGGERNSSAGIVPFLRHVLTDPDADLTSAFEGLMRLWNLGIVTEIEVDCDELFSAVEVLSMERGGK